jgi:hypothetical protein
MEDGIGSPDRKLIVGYPTNNYQDDEIGNLPEARPEDADEGIPSLGFYFFLV